MSSRFVQKENTLECQSIQVKYDFLQPWVKKHLGTQYLSLSFNTDNLFRVSSIKQERGIAYPFSREIYFLSFSNLLKFQQHEKDDLLYNDRLPPVRDRM